MRKIIKRANRYACYIAAFTLMVILLLTVADIFLRNVFIYYIRGVYELTQIFLSILVFLAVAYAQDNNVHVYIDFIYLRLSQKGKWLFSLISSLLYLGIDIVMTRYVLQFAIAQISRGDYTSTHHVPLWPISMLGVFGLLMFCFSVVGDLVFIIKDRGVLSLDAY